MPITISHQPDYVALGEVFRRGAAMQTAAAREERSRARLLQAQKSAEDRIWEERRMDKAAELADRHSVLQARLGMYRDRIHQEQQMAYEKARAGLLAPEKAKQRAFALEQLKARLEAQAEQQSAALQARAQLEAQKQQQKIENYRNMSAARQQIFDEAVAKRDRAIAAVESDSRLNARDKRRMINQIQADFLTAHGHASKPPEEQEVEEEFNRRVTPPDANGNRYVLYDNGKIDLLPTREDKLREVKLKEQELQHQALITYQKSVASLAAKYVATVTKEGGKVTPEEARRFAEGVLGGPPAAANGESSNPGQDVVELMQRVETPELGKALEVGSQEERKAALRELRQRVQSGDAEALALAKEYARRKYKIGG